MDTTGITLDSTQPILSQHHTVSGEETLLLHTQTKSPTQQSFVAVPFKQPNSDSATSDVAMQFHRGSPPTTCGLGSILSASLQSGKRLVQSHTRDFSHASSRFGDKDTSSSSETDSDDAAGDQGSGAHRYRRRKSSRTLARVSRALSPYVSLPRAAKSSDRADAGAVSTGSSADEAIAAAAAASTLAVPPPPESALAAEPGGGGVGGIFGVRDAIRRKLSLRRDRTSSMGESWNSESDSASFAEAGSTEDIAHLMEFSEKTNKDVHKLFPELTALDVHVDDFACAVQKEILIQGRLYLTNRHICFGANIFGYVTSIVVPFSHIAKIEKKTFLMIPSAIKITTKDQMEYLFASFVLRDQAFLKMVALLHASRKAESEHTLLAEIEAEVAESAAAAAAAGAAAAAAIDSALLQTTGSDSLHSPWENFVLRNPRGLLVAITALLVIALLATLSSGAMAWQILRAVSALDETVWTLVPRQFESR
ncbi:hypothetical protein HDU87_005969 [Geranomyces variabilis]|uniref:GRAM domain-containing protein n=1 Tax=Geranomyces variabilis TaxID=109894 RepID=A0AAD5TQ68_9FUNG|nr:hypothetical protein HDU87_005969 [Geranomyces variabilis]